MAVDASRHSWYPHSYPLRSSPAPPPQKRAAAAETPVAYSLESPSAEEPPEPVEHIVAVSTARISRTNISNIHAHSWYPIQTSPAPPQKRPPPRDYHPDSPAAKLPEPGQHIVAVSTAAISRRNVLNIHQHSSYPIHSSTFSPQPASNVQAVSAYALQTPPSDKMAQKSATPSTTHVSQPALHLPKVIRAVRDSNEQPQKGRTIIICLDGTGDQFDADNSNIVHFVSCLKKDDPSQLTYYQSGVGTYNGGGLSNGMSAAADMAIASGLGVHIRDAYKFLMQNYNEGDKISIFGFSRGAYTARCLAGMVHKVGILPASNGSQIAFVYKFYKDDSPQGWRSSDDFKRTFCIDANVHFIGVFDSVASVGFIPRKLPLSSTPHNRAVYFRHAMALDEHRAKFKPCRFKKRDSINSPGWETMAEEGEGEFSPLQAARLSNTTSPTNSTANTDEKDKSEKGEPKKLKHPPAPETDFLEVWFAGCHCDVGGGAVQNDVRHKLSNIPLRWMIRQCFECDTDILFSTHRLAEQGMDVHTLWPTYTALPQTHSRPSLSMMQMYKTGSLGSIRSRANALGAADSGKHGYKVHTWPDEQHKPCWVPEQDENYFDALQDTHDQLSEAKIWWILELFWPIKVRIQHAESKEWIKKVRTNMGRYRAVQELEPNLHWTVQRRMTDKGYNPKTRADPKAEWKIVA